MISCKRAAELISLSLETRLSWLQRLQLCWHLCVCRMCRNFRRHSRLIQQAGRRTSGEEPASPSLPEGARERIRQALRNRPTSSQ